MTTPRAPSRSLRRSLCLAVPACALSLGLAGAAGAASAPRPSAGAGAALAAAADALVAGGAAVVLLDAATGAERYAGGWVDRPTPPGSLFKLVTALAAGDARAPLLTATLRCPAPRLPAPPCGHAHGAVTFQQAVALSCNAYFAQLGAAVGGERLLGAARALGLSRLPAPGAVAGATLGATGEGVRVTPREVGALLRAIATGQASSRGVPGAALLPRLRDGLRLSVQQGTAQGAGAPGEAVSAAGKTGTAVLGAGTVGWFAGYAPATEPALIVVAAQRDHRGAEVATAAAGLLRAYFHGGGAGAAPGRAPLWPRSAREAGRPPPGAR